VVAQNQTFTGCVDTREERKFEALQFDIALVAISHGRNHPLSNGRTEPGGNVGESHRDDYDQQADRDQPFLKSRESSARV
jgi:hypothetical protein